MSDAGSAQRPSAISANGNGFGFVFCAFHEMKLRHWQRQCNPKLATGSKTRLTFGHESRRPPRRHYPQSAGDGQCFNRGGGQRGGNFRRRIVVARRNRKNCRPKNKFRRARKNSWTPSAKTRSRRQRLAAV